jgi:hypothetical protein
MIFCKNNWFFSLRGKGVKTNSFRAAQRMEREREGKNVEETVLTTREKEGKETDSDQATHAHFPSLPPFSICTEELNHKT